MKLKTRTNWEKCLYHIRSTKDYYHFKTLLYINEEIIITITNLPPKEEKNMKYKWKIVRFLNEQAHQISKKCSYLKDFQF